MGLELSSCAAPQTQSVIFCFSLNLNHLLVSGFLGGASIETGFLQAVSQFTRAGTAVFAVSGFVLDVLPCPHPTCTSCLSCTRVQSPRGCPRGTETQQGGGMRLQAKMYRLGKTSEKTQKREKSGEKRSRRRLEKSNYKKSRVFGEAGSCSRD